MNCQGPSPIGKDGAGRENLAPRRPGPACWDTFARKCSRLSPPTTRLPFHQGRELVSTKLIALGREFSPRAKNPFLGPRRPTGTRSAGRRNQRPVRRIFGRKNTRHERVGPSPRGRAAPFTGFPDRPIARTSPLSAKPPQARHGGRMTAEVDVRRPVRKN